MLGLPNSLLLKLPMRTLFPGFILLSCLAVEGLHPLTAHSAPYRRSCIYNSGLQGSGPHTRLNMMGYSWKEEDIYRYNNGLYMTFCDARSMSLDVMVNCKHKVLYAKQNDGSYSKGPSFPTGSIGDVVCKRYFF